MRLITMAVMLGGFLSACAGRIGVDPSDLQGDAAEPGWTEPLDDSDAGQPDAGQPVPPAPDAGQLPDAGHPPPPPPTSNCCFIVAGNKANGRVEVYRPDVPWTSSSALFWSWEPTPSLPSFTAPVAMRVRDNPVWGKAMVVASTAGYFAVVGYPDKKVRYSWTVPASASLHGIELLPNGNVVIAAAGDDFVRIYAASTRSSPSNTRYAEDRSAEMRTPHQVLWDPQSKLLWALTYSHLCSYSDVGTGAAPKLAGRTCYALPGPNGHDLQPYLHDANRMILSTGYAVYVFTKSTRSFAVADEFPGLSRHTVKSVSRNGNLSPAQWLETVPDHVSCGAFYTDTVNFFGYTGPVSRRRPGACFYRAAFWTYDYQ